MSDAAPLTVLLVEDDPGDTALFRALLGHTPAFEQRHASTLAGAIAELEGTEIDAILLDLGLPDSDMEQTWRRIHEIAPWAAVIVLTGHDDSGVDLESLAEGAQDFLVKNDVTEMLLAKTIRYAVERHRAFRAHLGQRVQELEIFESLGAGSSSPDEELPARETLEEAAATYRSVLDAAVADGTSATEAEFVVQLRDLAGRLADRRATPTDLAAIHTETLSDLQPRLTPEQFATHEDVARLLLLRLTGELANQYLRRGPVSSSVEEPDGETGPATVGPVAVPDDARQRLVGALESLITSRSLLDLTLDDVADQANLDRRAAAEAVTGVMEPFGELARQEFARQRDVAEVMLVATRSGSGTVQGSVTAMVTTLSELWQSNRYLTLAAIAASTDDETVRDLRAGHLRELSLSLVEVLEDHFPLDSVDDRRRAARGVASLMATLDQRLVVGDMYPPNDDQLAHQLGGELMLHLPAPASTSADAASAEPATNDRAEPPAPPVEPARGQMPPPDEAADDDARDRSLTEADYAAWAGRMKARRREEIERFAPDPPSQD